MIKKIIYLTYTRPEYSLNLVLIKGLKENGIEVLEFYSKDKGIQGFLKALSFYRNNSKNADLVAIGYNSPALVGLMRLFCRKTIIFNAVLSEYERMIISRKLARPFSLKALYYWFLDFTAVHLADLTLLESAHQIGFFRKMFKVSKKRLYRNWIGVDKNKFFYDPSIKKLDVFTIVFRGALMPEAGAEYVIKTAKMLEGKNCKFIMVGGGLLSNKIKQLIEDVQPMNLEYIADFLPDEELRKTMQKCHISLGQLSDHPRLTRTLPHKVYESLSMKLPYLTASNTGILELLTPNKTCLTCNPADAQSLADKILWAGDNYSEVDQIAERGYELYLKELRSDILARNLLNRMKEL